MQGVHSPPVTSTQRDAPTGRTNSIYPENALAFPPASFNLGNVTNETLEDETAPDGRRPRASAHFVKAFIFVTTAVRNTQQLVRHYVQIIPLWPAEIMSY